VGVFLVAHLYTNAAALQGPAAFARPPADPWPGLPFVVLIEAIGIWIPISFTWCSGSSSRRPASRHRAATLLRGTAYTLQRASGILIVFYILYHTGLCVCRPNCTLAAPYDYVSNQLANRRFLFFARVYRLGTVGPATTSANGLFGFAIHWGLSDDRAGQRRSRTSASRSSSRCHSSAKEIRADVRVPRHAGESCSRSRTGSSTARRACAARPLWPPASRSSAAV